MSMLSAIHQSLAKHAGRADLRLFEAILTQAPAEAEPGQTALAVDKASVLETLFAAEGKTLSDDVIRSRVRNLKAAFAAIGRTHYGIEDGFVDIRSRKDRFVLTWSQGAKDMLDRKTTKRVVAEAAHADNVIPESDLVESRVTISTHQVFISHSSEAPGIGRILDAFHDRLEQRLKNLPQKYRDKFAVRVWFDRDDIHARAEFQDQTDPACERSEFAILMTSDKWFASPACRREFEHFRDRASKENGRPFVLVQLAGDPADQDAEFQGFPCLPPWWDKKYKTLVSLWEKGDEDDKDRFITYLRNQICDYLVAHADTSFDPEPIGPSKPVRPRRLRDVYAASASVARDIAEDMTVETRVRFAADKPDELDEAGESTPALPLLEDWATSKSSEHRILAVIGGFGMGKTVAVQRLADRLSRRRSGPIPVYLDFRRLIQAASPGEPIRTSLSEIIHTAINKDAAGKIGAAELVEMIRSEPCVVIFDGLDEVGNRIGREHAAALYRQLTELVPRDAWAADARNGGRPDWGASPTRIIVTCRTHFFRSLREEQSTFACADRSGRQLRTSIRTLHMAPLDLDAIRTLFVKSLGEDAGERTFQTVQSVHDLPGLARRPIMARYIGEIAGELLLRHQAGRTINIATVYEELFDRALERDSEKVPLLSPSDRIDILKALAMHLHRSAASELDVDALERWFDGFASAHAGIKLALTSQNVGGRGLLQTELRNASFLVRVRDDRFVFAHTSFYEYFLGIALLDAVLAGDVGAFAHGPPSDETIAFCFAAARQNDDESKVGAALNGLIASDASLDSRALAWRMMWIAAGRSVPVLPTGANLSGLDLQDMRLEPGTVWDGVRLNGTILTGLDARGAAFRNADFAGARIGDACFDDCRFAGCTGIPKGGSSARLWRGICDAASEPVLGDIRFRWPGDHDAPSLPLHLNHGAIGLVLSVAFAPDGATLLTGGYDGTARLWDTRTGGEIRRFEGHGRPVASVAFAPDGATLATGGSDGTARLWDTRTGGEIRRFEGLGNWVSSVAFAPDGATLATGGDDRTARLWDTRTGGEIRRFEGHGRPVASVAFTPDGATLATGGSDGTARLWDTRTGGEIRRFEGHGNWVSSVAFAPDGATLATGGDDGTARLWDTRTGGEIRRFEGHGRPVTSVAFTPDGATLATGGDDGTARLWDTRTGGEIRRFEGHGDGARSVAFAPDGATLATGGYDGTARLWDTRTGGEIRRFEGLGNWVSSVAFAPDGATLATGGYDGTAWLWDTRTGGEIRRFEGHGDGVSSVAFAPDGATLATGGSDGTARLWDTRTGGEIRRFEGHGDGVSSVAFAPDGATLATGGYDGTARLWDTRTGGEIRRFEGHGDGVSSVAFAPDGATLAAGGSDRTARLWDTRTGGEIRRFEGHGNWVSSVAFAPDGATLATGGSDGTAWLWDTRTGGEIRRFERHGNWVSSVAFAPDGATLATGGDDGTAWLWDTRTGGEIRRFERHGGSVSRLAFAPDGATLLTGGYDGTARLWDTRTGGETYGILHLGASWAVFSADGELARHGPNMWRYAHALAPSESGLPRVVAPDEAALTRLEAVDNH